MTLNMMLQPRMILLLSFVLFLLCFLVPSCYSQITGSPQNIETFYPTKTSAPSPAPAPTTQRPQPPPPPPPPDAKGSKGGSSSNGKVAKAVAATAASTIVICGLLFIILQRCLRARKRKEVARPTNNSSAGDSRVAPQANAFERIDGNVKGLIVDEDGLDVVYWRKLEGRNSKSRGLHKEVLHNSPKNREKDKEKEKEEDVHEGITNNQVKKSKSIQEVPLLRGKSSTSHMNIVPEVDEPYRMEKIPIPASVGAAVKDFQKPDSPNQSSTPPPPASPSTPSSDSLSAIPKGNRNSPAAPAPPPPPPPIPARKSPAPAAPAPPPPPPKAGSLRSSSKKPPAPVELLAASTSKRANSSGKGVAESNNDQVKLKPLHWDKVNTNAADHSMVWDKVDRGSFRVDQDLMEALFGYVAANRRSPKRKSPSKDTSAKVFLLDPKKSQNIAIVLKSLAVSQEEILDALVNGRGLNADTLEKIVRIAPTEEEQYLILQYKGDPARLAAAESSLYHILNAVPLAFKRSRAMLFRLNYGSEIQEIKDSLQVLELGCKELRNQRIFVKLLEAVLKAGNRMNAGTARGDAQAFNLASLRKLSDVKSTNGKTTLLHFVVEEVVRSEGKRVLLSRNGSLSRSSSKSSNNSNDNFENNAASDVQREREYTKLGLPVVGGISSEFSNVKKAAFIDYNTLVGSISTLSTQLLETQEIVSRCRKGEGGYFVKEMEHFIRNAEEELRSVREEQTRVMQLIKRTTEYYQGGVTRDIAENSFQLFVIVKDFMGMVDQVCIEIARNMQKRKTHKASSYG